jgi:Lipocalin-like domain
LRNGRSDKRVDWRLDLTLCLSQAGRHEREDPHVRRQPARRSHLARGRPEAAIITPSHQSDDAPPPRRKLLAYSGRYRIENDDRFVTDVDIAWMPNWVGTPRGRKFSLRDGLLHIASGRRLIKPRLASGERAPGVATGESASGGRSLNGDMGIYTY